MQFASYFQTFPPKGMVNIRKAVRHLSTVFLIFIICIFSLVIYAQCTIPDEINIVQGKEFKDDGIFSFALDRKTETANATENRVKNKEEYELKVSLFNSILLKKSGVTVNRRSYVTISGRVFGIRLYSDGVVVVSLQEIETEKGKISPGKIAGIKSGDVITLIDDKKVSSNSDISEICEKSNGKKMKIVYRRNGRKFTAYLQTVKDKSGSYKAGLWVRDSTAGIGTMTFYDRETGVFASLGHAVCDVDTEIVLPISGGEAVSAKILGCNKSSDGQAGELCGVFGDEIIGKLYVNGKTGLYGFSDDMNNDGAVMPVAIPDEIKTGKAKIYCSIDGEKPKYYDVEITRVNLRESGEKNMTVKITDSELLKLTGGIVQGMSGTPLIQNGMLVGAITHVFVNNPQEGYAIFAETMMATANNTAQTEK